MKPNGPVPPPEPAEGPQTPPAPAIEWYHPDPDQPYTELRSGVSGGIGRAIMIGVAISATAVVLMYGAVWINSGGAGGGAFAQPTPRPRAIYTTPAERPAATQPAPTIEPPVTPVLAPTTLPHASASAADSSR